VNLQLRIELYGEKYDKRYGYAVLTAVLKNQNPIKIRQTIRYSRIECRIDCHITCRIAAVPKQIKVSVLEQWCREISFSRIGKHSNNSLAGTELHCELDRAGNVCA